jgi:hypothetical protein
MRKFAKQSFKIKWLQPNSVSCFLYHFSLGFTFSLSHHFATVVIIMKYSFNFDQHTQTLTLYYSFFGAMRSPLAIFSHSFQNVYHVAECRSKEGSAPPGIEPKQFNNQTTPPKIPTSSTCLSTGAIGSQVTDNSQVGRSLLMSYFMASSRLAGKKISIRRRAKRDGLWPDAEDVVFSPIGGGWVQMPRTIPMLASLIDMLAGRENAGRLYIVLWAYEYGDGFVEVPDPAQLALEAGYMNKRAERTFAERVSLLEKLGCIRTAKLGLREHGFILLLNPHNFASKLRKNRPRDVPDSWWSAFQARCTNIGVPLAPESPAPPNTTPESEELF